MIHIYVWGIYIIDTEIYLKISIESHIFYGSIQYMYDKIMDGAHSIICHLSMSQIIVVVVNS